MKFNELEFVFNLLAVKMMQELKQNDEFPILKDDEYLKQKRTKKWIEVCLMDGFK